MWPRSFRLGRQKRIIEESREPDKQPLVPHRRPNLTAGLDSARSLLHTALDAPAKEDRR